MKIKKFSKTISITELVERVKINKKEKNLNVAIIDQNFLKRTEEKFISTSDQAFFLLKSKIGLIQKKAVIEVFINGMKVTDYQIRTSTTDSSKSELYFPNYNFYEGEAVVIVY